MSASLLAMPAIRSLPSGAQQAQTWRALYLTGAGLGPPIGLASAGVLALNAWQSSTSPKMWLLVGAAALAMANGPHTLLLMKSTNDALLRRAAAADKREDVSKVETESLLTTWNTWNYMRSCYAIVSGALALYATRL